jgi:hypothetical protein
VERFGFNFKQSVTIFKSTDMIIDIFYATENSSKACAEAIKCIEKVPFIKEDTLIIKEYK